jgi:hypothetical protein
MPLRFDINRRLEPRRPAGDLDAGFRAAIGDPVWFLGRQWQMAEHQGEDGARRLVDGRPPRADRPRRRGVGAGRPPAGG